jgi:hypothetical protein
VPDAPRPPDLGYGTPSQTPSASHRAASAGPLPRVVGGLLRGQPEMAILLKAATNVARVDLVDDRLALVSTVLATRPAALVLPPFDEAHTSTAPLVLRVRRDAPGIAVLVVACHPGGAGQPFLRAVQAGARVIPAATAEQLREALVGLFGPRDGS